MSRIPFPPQPATGSRALLERVEQDLGFVPNVMRTIGLSPAALDGHLAFQRALATALDDKMRSQIAIAVSQINGSAYCVASNAYFAKRHVTADELALNRTGHSATTRTDAALCFASKVMETRGNVADADLAAIRAAGFSDQEIVEIVATSVFHLFTNFISNVCDPDIEYLFATDDVFRTGP